MPIIDKISLKGTTYDIGISSANLPTASTSVKGAVKVDGSSITIDANGVISASGGGGDVRLGDVLGVSAIGTNTKVYLKLTDPADLVVSGVTIAKLDGTLVVRKVGSAPMNKNDGTIVINSKIRDNYSANSYIDDNLTTGVTYYYRFFPYTIENTITEGTSLNVITTLNLVSLSTGTDDEIEHMLFSYYESDISLEDIKSVWSIGDIRQANSTDKVKMKIAAHNSFTGDKTPSFSEQSTCKLVILDFDHDTLTTSIGSITKALITIQMFGTLGTSASGAISELMTTTGETTGGLASMPRRTHCNGNFYNALGFKTLVKQVVKENCATSSGTITTTNDYCFLISEYELFGTRTKAYGIEGTQYEYLKTSSNRTKGAGLEGAGSKSGYLLRSIYDYQTFVVIDTYGNVGTLSAKTSYSYYVSPACAL